MVSESTFDAARATCSIEVDKNEPVKADGLDGAKMVVFKGPAAATLVAQFKAGLKAEVVSCGSGPAGRRPGPTRWC